MGSSQTNAGWLEAFREGMAELGWVDGRDYTIDARFANGSSKAGEQMARELGAANPDVILVPAEGALRVILQHAKTVPVVTAIAGDLIGGGFATSLRRPGGNVTGLLAFGPDLAQKQVGLLKEAVPGMSHIGIFFEPGDGNSAAAARQAPLAAKRLNLRFSLLELHEATDVDQVVSEAKARGVDGALIAIGYLANLRKQELASSLAKAKVPSIFGFVDAGGLLSYTSLRIENFRRAASYVDKIFKGAVPGELPIEQPTSVRLSINLKVAKAMGINVPKELLLRADEVIE